MTAHAADWLTIAVFCVALAGCAERPADAILDPLPACGDICKPLRRVLDILPAVAAAPVRAPTVAPAAPAAPMRTHHVHVRPASRLARRPAVVPATVVAMVRPPRPAVRAAAPTLPIFAQGGLRGALPGSSAIVQPWFQPWPRAPI